MLADEKAMTAVGFLGRAIKHFASYRDSAERTAALAGWIDLDTHRRPHGALGHKPPNARLNELNNPLGPYT